MNLVPLADIAFLLLIFFLFGTTFVLQSGIKVAVPFSPFLLSPIENPRIITVTEPPHSKIYFQNRQVAPEDLPARLAEAGTGSGTLLLKADKRTPYELVTRISTAGIEAGFTVVLATNPEADPSADGAQPAASAVSVPSEP